MFEPFQVPAKYKQMGQIQAKMSIGHKTVTLGHKQYLKSTHSPLCFLIQDVLFFVVIFYLLLTHPKAHFEC